MADVFVGQRMPYAIKIEDSHVPPRQARIDGVPIAVSSDATVLAVQASPDGMSGYVVAIAPGTARIAVTIDVDLGAGRREMTGLTEDVHVVVDPAQAVGLFTITFGAAEG